MTKPRDMLEFFRRTAPEGADVEPPPPALEPTTRMLVLRRSQAVVAGAAAVAALVLAFLLGHAVGASGGDAAPEVFVIRAVSYAGDEQGKASARTMKEQLEKMDLGEEVSVFDVPSEKSTVVTVGSWLTNPEGISEARALREKLRGMKVGKQATPFSKAEFWPMKR